MLWSIDSCQNRVHADQYHLAVSQAQVPTHRGRVFFKVIRWKVTSFQMIAGSSFFLIHVKYFVFVAKISQLFNKFYERVLDMRW